MTRRFFKQMLQSPSWQPRLLGPLVHIVAERDRRAAVAEARAELASIMYANALQNVYDTEAPLREASA